MRMSCRRKLRPASLAGWRSEASMRPSFVDTPMKRGSVPLRAFFKNDTWRRKTCRQPSNTQHARATRTFLARYCGVQSCNAFQSLTWLPLTSTGVRKRESCTRGNNPPSCKWTLHERVACVACVCVSCVSCAVVVCVRLYSAACAGIYLGSDGQVVPAPLQCQHFCQLLLGPILRAAKK